MDRVKYKKAITQTKVSSTECKATDGHGLFLWIRTNGNASWKYTFRFDGKQKNLTLGTYLLTTLNQARKKHFEARQILENGQVPFLR